MDNTKNVVVLLHGIARSSRSMRSLEKALRKENYQILNLNYPSCKKDLIAIAAEVFQPLHPYHNNPNFTLHFVSHSMGGLVIRKLLTLYPIHNIGRVVMIAPPNQGSEVADFLKNNILYKKFFGPAGQQLTTSYAQTDLFEQEGVEIGVIAGCKVLDPFSHFILRGMHDGRVTVASTKLKGMRDHIIIAATHTFITYHRETVQQTLHFLKQARFAL